MNKLIICILLSALIVVSLVSARIEIEEDGVLDDSGWVNNALVNDNDFSTFSEEGGIGGGRLYKSYNGLSIDKEYTYVLKHNTSGIIETSEYTIPIDCLDNLPMTTALVHTSNSAIHGCYDSDSVIFYFLFENRPYSVFYEDQLYEETPPTIFIRHNNEDIQIPYTYFERKENNAWVINLPKVLFRRFVRWISG